MSHIKYPKTVLEKVMGKTRAMKIQQRQLTPALQKLDEGFSELIDELIEPLMVKRMKDAIATLQKDRKLRAKGRGTPVFFIDKDDDVQKIDEYVKALQTVVSYYSSPF